MPSNYNELQVKIDAQHKNLDMVKNEISKIIVGQESLIQHMLMALLCNGHILLEGYPGLAKTLTIETLSKILDISFKRIQFTPDLLPSDLTGSLIYNQQSGTFTPEKGPIFTNFLMADEINRAPAKVQSALLECMQEKKVTIGNETYKLEFPFFVMATQNPIEQEGTYELPEAQKDRFMFKVNVNYPSKEEEMKIIERVALSSFDSVKTLMDKNNIKEWQDTVKEIYVDEKIKHYVLNIVFASREPHRYSLKHVANFIKLGASPRASIYLIRASQAKAMLENRSYVIPEDVVFVSQSILQHRILASYEAMAESVSQHELVQEIVKAIKVP